MEYLCLCQVVFPLQFYERVNLIEEELTALRSLTEKVAELGLHGHKIET
jgi:hypothetical protein